mmetsp:Transcript_85296/g.238224  ORF Transcript_85296/g.238224 Transcript_85296/m.238224 type:complete len:212 (+) Transcript_85296:519-1154(+)
MVIWPRSWARPTSEMSTPPSRTRPSSRSSRRKMTPIRVDLPEPVRPTMPIFSRASKVALRQSSALGALREYLTLTCSKASPAPLPGQPDWARPASPGSFQGGSCSGVLASSTTRSTELRQPSTCTIMKDTVFRAWLSRSACMMLTDARAGLAPDDGLRSISIARVPNTKAPIQPWRCSVQRLELSRASIHSMFADSASWKRPPKWDSRPKA